MQYTNCIGKNQGRTYALTDERRDRQAQHKTPFAIEKNAGHEKGDVHIILFFEK